jgi:hypothetical protein
MTEPQPSPMRGFVGGMMVVIGVLMVTLCGLCTAVFAIGALVDLAQRRSGGELFSGGSLLQAALMLGLPPIAVGALLVWGGLRVRRQAPPVE